MTLITRVEPVRRCFDWLQHMCTFMMWCDMFTNCVLFDFIFLCVIDLEPTIEHGNINQTGVCGSTDLPQVGHYFGYVYNML
jgi:hypothetical protein